MADFTNMTPQSIAAWNNLTRLWGSVPGQVTSTYRTPEENQRVGGARQSQHLHGNAFDVSVAGMPQEEQIRLIQAAREAGFGGVGVYGNSLHFDVGPTRHWGGDYTAASLPSWAADAVGATRGEYGPLGQGGTMSNATTDIPQRPQGLLERMGLQRRDEAAGGEAAMPFYQRPQFREFATNLGLAMGGLSTRPNEMALRELGRRQDQRSADALANRTVQWLSQQPGGETFVRMIEAGANPAQAIAAWQQAQAQEAERQRALTAPRPMELREVGGALYGVDPITGQSSVLIEGRTGFRVATPEEVQQYGTMGQVDVETGRFYPVNPPSGMTIETTADGGMRLVQGPGAGRDLTEGQRTDVLYATRARGAAERLDAIDESLASREQMVLGMLPLGLGREYQDPVYQQASQAAQEFLNAILRRDTGAAITAEEYEQYGSMYLPQPGDSPAVIQQKRLARQGALAALEVLLNEEQRTMQSGALGGQPSVRAPSAPQAPSAPPAVNDAMQLYGR